MQESGRAGRDGKAASCVVFYTREERDRVIYRVSLDGNREVRGGGESSRAQKEARLCSLRKVVEYCESTGRCRHELIKEYFAEREEGEGEGEVKGEGQVEETICDYACDYCKEGALKLRKRMERGLADEEMAFEFSQRERTDRNGWDGYEDA